jgi:hypothetical protein
MTKNAWLIALFGFYLAAIPVFATIYFYLYRRKRSSFVFARDIADSRLAAMKADADDQIKSLELLNEYFIAFIADQKKNSAKVEDDPDRFLAVLEGGRRIVIERHIQHIPPHGAESELLPYAELWRGERES